MGFGGSVSAMIASMKANKRSRVSTFDKIKHLKKRNHIAVHFKNEATPKELKILKAKIQRNHKKKALKSVVILLVIIALLIYAIGFVEI
jgi:hypothetical protein|tara:strand:- start:311 stop:577 length:267 start_codon:yes stop_codon:yes gene_type:complete